MSGVSAAGIALVIAVLSVASLHRPAVGVGISHDTRRGQSALVVSTVLF